MGFFKKVFRPIRKVAKKIIPKEIRPALPFLASAAFGPAGMFANVGTNYVANAALRQALAAGITSAATDEDGNPLRAAGLAAAPALLSQGVGALGQGTGSIADFVNKTKTIRDGDKIMQTKSLVEKARALAEPSGAINTAKVVGGQTAVDQSAKFAEIRQDEIDEYNRNLLEQGVASKVDRRKAIFGIYQNAGYEEDYINTMLDTYGYADGGITTLKRGLVDQAGSYAGFDIGKAESLASARSIDDILPKRKPISDIEVSEDDDVTIDENGKIKVKRKPSKSDMASGLASAMNAVQTAYGRSFGEMEPVPMMRFARGGEVEVEEQTEDLGIMDLMRDQGVEYGEQVSNAQNDELLEKLFEEFLDLGFSPEDAAKKAREAFDDMSQGQGIKGTQVASGYKDDIEEMYEQYVFEMEEQGLQPMDFASFLRQARSGMANGGKVKRRKKGEPADEVIETEEEIFLDKMPRPKRKGIMEAAGGGSVGSRYSFLINKQKQGILSPDEEQELLMLEMTYADESQGKADGGIMNKNLLNTGVDKDMRGGGFIPEGTKEKADDVPARLSKNEFVMTADAVRAAGGGSVNKGAKKMYDLMYTLEAKV